MRVGINASFLRKPATGIGQVTRHFLEELSRSFDESPEWKEKDVEFSIYLEESMPLDIRLSSKFSVRSFLPFVWQRDDLIRKMLWEMSSLPRQAKKDGCDVLLSLYQSATVAPNGMRHIMLVHDIIPRLFPEYLNNARKRTYQNLIERAIMRVDTIVSVSAKTKEDLIDYLGVAAEKISVNLIDVDPSFKQEASAEEADAVMRKYSLQPGYIYLGGGLEKRKNAEGLLQAYKLLVDDNKREKFVDEIPKLVISGKLMPELAPLIVDVERSVNELNLSTRVQVLGFVPQEDLPSLYAKASFFAFPSLYEGFGMPVLEAMSQGTPVLTSNTTSLPEVGKDAVAYCDPESVEDIAAAMRKLLLDDGMRATLGARGKKRSLEFSWNNFVQKILKIL